METPKITVNEALIIAKEYHLEAIVIILMLLDMINNTI